MVPITTYAAIVQLNGANAQHLWCRMQRRYGAAQSAVAAPSRMARNAAQLGKREVSNGSLDQCAWARSRAALSAALLCVVVHGPAEAARC